MSMLPAAAESQSSLAARLEGLAPTLLRVAWMSVLLGVAMEVLFLLLEAALGGSGSVAKYAADFLQKLSWSTLVCVGLALGNGAAKARAAWMGLLGLLAAPAAFTAARAVHKSATQALSLAQVGVFGPSPWTLGLIKAAEYAVLGWVLGWLSARGELRASRYALCGAAAGSLFGGWIVILRVQAILAQQPTVSPLAWAPLAANEIAFPIGCSLVIWGATAMSKIGAKR